MASNFQAIVNAQAAYQTLPDFTVPFEAKRTTVVMLDATATHTVFVSFDGVTDAVKLSVDALFTSHTFEKCASRIWIKGANASPVQVIAEA